MRYIPAASSVSAGFQARAWGLSRLFAAALIVVAAAACGDSDDGPASPSPPPSGSATLVIENFTATSTAGPGGTFNYRASLRVRETGGAAATITGVTLTMTQTSGVSVSQDVAASQAFPSATVTANGTLDSVTLAVDTVPIAASQLGVRITYTSPSGATSTVSASANVTTSS